MAHGSFRFHTNAAFALRDFALGLLLFWAVTIGLCALQGQAHALGLPNAQAAAYETEAATLLRTEKASYYATVANGPLRELNPTEVSARPTMLMLGFVFSLLTMLNLAFVRHVRRAYAAPKGLAAKVIRS